MVQLTSVVEQHLHVANNINGMLLRMSDSSCRYRCWCSCCWLSFWLIWQAVDAAVVDVDDDDDFA